MIGLLNKHYSGDQIKATEMNGVRSTNCRKEKYIQDFFLGKPDGMRPLGERKNTWKGSMKIVSKKKDRRMWTGFIYCRTGTSKTSCSIKWMGERGQGAGEGGFFFWLVDELLASEERFYSLESDGMLLIQFQIALQFFLQALFLFMYCVHFCLLQALCSVPSVLRSCGQHAPLKMLSVYAVEGHRGSQGCVTCLLPCQFQCPFLDHQHVLCKFE